jgi:hypothetical protein
MIVSDHHRLIAETLMRVVGGEISRLIINIPPGYSKAIDVDTPMWTKDGWKKASEITTLDYLLGSDGNFTKVVGVFPQGIKKSYKVQFNDGSSLVTCSDHNWAVRLRDNTEKWQSPFRKKTTGQISNDLLCGDGRLKWQIPIVGKNKDGVSLPIDPYLFGCWLGDGHSHYAAITTMDDEIKNAFIAAGHELKEYKHQNGGRSKTYGILGGFHSFLKSYNLYKNKHIPDIFYKANYLDKIALLQGIFDTDGCVATANGQQSFTSSFPRLASDVKKLLTMVGGTYNARTNKTTHKDSYYINFKAPVGECLFRLSRKTKLINKRKECNKPKRFIKDISEVSERNQVCFSVEAEDHLFCAGEDFIITHNTEMAVISFIAYGLAIDPQNRFMHLSYSDSLALQNSTVVRDIVTSEEYQKMWPVRIKADDNSKKKWWSDQNGGVYATSAGGQVTGFRAGHIKDGFSGALVIDDPTKPDDADYEERKKVNTRFNETIKSRLAHEGVPIVVIMQRIHPMDLSGYLLRGGSGEKWHHLNLPVIIDSKQPYPKDYTHGIQIKHKLKDGWLWSVKHNDAHKLSLRSHKRAYFAQYMQSPEEYKIDGALWDQSTIDKYRVHKISLDDLVRIVVAVDPSGDDGEDDSTADEIGIGVVGRTKDGHYYVLNDSTMHGSPSQWGAKCVEVYNRFEADIIVAEKNFGGAMVKHTIRSVAGGQKVAYKDVTASRGKMVRAEPISALYEQGLVHHVGNFYELENELTSYNGKGKSPNRLDWVCWGIAELSSRVTNDISIPETSLF